MTQLYLKWSEPYDPCSTLARSRPGPRRTPHRQDVRTAKETTRVPPTDTPTLTDLCTALAGVLPHGAARPAHLARDDAGPLLELLTPPGPLGDRAYQAHALLVAAIEAMGEPEHESARVLFCLTTPTATATRSGRRSVTPTLAARRRRVAMFYGLSENHIRNHHEPLILHAVAVELSRRIPHQRPPQQAPAPPADPFTPPPISLTRIPPPRDLGPTQPPTGPQPPPRRNWHRP
jgi:hypothetical protein